MQFNAMVTAKLDAYVYALADPRLDGALRDRVFYIGKGNGNRCFNHAHVARGKGEEPLDEGEHKLGRIREIHRCGLDVEVFVVAHGLSDDEAHAIEAVLIPLLGDTNKVSGHGDQNLWLSSNQINEAYDHPIQRGDIPLFRGNILFVSLNRQNTSSLLESDDENQLAQATLGDWGLSVARSSRVDCIVGVKNGLIVSIFETDKSSALTTDFVRIPSEKKRAHGRSRFVGRRRLDLEQHLRGRSVFHDEKCMSTIRRGAGCEFYEAMHSSQGAPLN
ncbi:GIY-YIG nuclease family protein [Thetidibacter halocola]|uniref:GIY-YIG nuclease family protein n=1 Tax=Thetidibacter halocola TaxID=2827239 RepID=A0A8J8BC32_9RHOB|nr:GIY-YIG nuclease family protein [Thetidibacter halocola]MBS0126858.1 GIY-YIG nuclease family protein [Thetidibacter halocola]